MGIFEELQEELKFMDKESTHCGYWYSINHALIILVMGTLCVIQNVSDIYQWAKSANAGQFLQMQFAIDKIMCRSHFYKILAVVEAEKFKQSFIRWMQEALNSVAPSSDIDGNAIAIAGKTVAIDGKTINSTRTSNRAKDGSILNIVSAHIGELKMTIGSHECMRKR